MKTYTFHVWLPNYDGVSRKIEMRADQTLEDLHLAIQDAFEFDYDHLYSFFMSGRAWDRATEYKLPDEVAARGLKFQVSNTPPQRRASYADYSTLTPEEVEERLQADSARMGVPVEALRSFVNLVQEIDEEEQAAEAQDVRYTRLEDLNLKARKSFLYLFDYDVQWRFRVRLERLNLRAGDADYPQVVESIGELPTDYTSSDDFFTMNGDS